MLEFAELNKEGFRKIVKKFRKHSKLVLPNNNIDRMVSNIFHNSFISRNHNELLYLLENIEEVLSTHFYSNQMKRESVRSLRKIVKKKNKLSKNQKRFLKFFFAFVFFFLLIIIWSYFT